MELTEEQRQIVEMIRQGKTNAYIAEKIHLSESSIEKKLAGLFRIFRVTNRVQLAMKVKD